MKNTVFEDAIKGAREYKQDYQERVSAAKKQLQDYEDKRAAAAAQADEAVSAEDLTAWKLADKERTDAEAGIKFTGERLARIQEGANYPIGDYEAALQQIEAEIGRATLELTAALQELYKKSHAAYDQFKGIMDESRAALDTLYRSGGGKEEGYRHAEDYQPNWLYLLNNGGVFTDKLLRLDVKTGTGLNSNDPIHRAVGKAHAAIRKAGVK